MSDTPLHDELDMDRTPRISSDEAARFMSFADALRAREINGTMVIIDGPDMLPLSLVIAAGVTALTEGGEE